LADGDVGDGAEVYEVYYGEVSVGGGDVGVEAQAGAEEGWAVLEEQQDQGGREENAHEPEDAIVAGAAHLLMFGMSGAA
jgi:hypothetical protein